MVFSQSFLQAQSLSTENTPVSANNNQQSKEIRLWGMIPVKSVSVEAADRAQLIPSGNTFGVKMFTKGAVVIGMSSIPTAQGNICPGKESGIQEGDIILSVNKKEIARNEEVALIIENCNGKPLLFEVQRGEETKTITLNPVLSSADNRYKSGIWIRDSAAGIGTITYVDPKNNVFAGLGHAICDVDTGEILPVDSGEICDVSIHNINKGKSGTPGELLGVFSSDIAIGNIVYNNNTGIYGQLFQSYNGKSYPMAFKQEVETGPAVILCSLNDGESKEYDIKITSVDYNEKNQVKNMTIQVTDSELLELTGGIVQGMSGTPILQNGKLVGAVTHVFVNDPEKGYGIFAENMYQYSKSIESYQNAA